jgi:transcriptional regulator GlxA family with amidase domain
MNDAAYARQSASPERLVVSTGDLAAPTFGQLGQLGLRIRGGLRPRTLRRVHEYVEAHLDKTISIRALAAVAELSMYHFARAFKQSSGMTPHEYLVQCRVRRVRDLLVATDLTLSEIALASGFADQSHCARRFREHFGVTPGSYRWSMR